MDRQNLIKRRLVRDKTVFLKTITGFRKDGFCHCQTLTDRAIGVVTQALAIGNGHEKEIERRCLVTQVFDAALTDQTVIQPTELFGRGANKIGTDWVFVYHFLGLLGVLLVIH